MAQLAQNVIQHDFGFPRIARAEDAEMAALYAKIMAEQVMRDLAGALDRTRLRPFGERIVSRRLNEDALPSGGIFGPLRNATGFLRSLSPVLRIVKTAHRVSAKQ